jgi:hypothetical protein
MDSGEETLFGPPEQSSGTSEVTVYTLSNGNRISSRDLPHALREDQIDAMRKWFYQKYEDPVHSCPYDSREGGYQYVYGGPFEADEELNSEFSGIVDDDVIEELADELENVTPYWSGNSDNFAPDIDDYLFQTSAESFRHADAFHQSVSNIERLLEAHVEPADRQCMLRLLYVNVITALETYLSDKFISSVNGDEKLLRKFVETTPEFRNQRMSLSDVFSTHENIKKRVQEHLLDVVWHRLDKVGPMFKDTLEIVFPPDLRELHKALLVRHDCVHRNGRTKEGDERILSENDIRALLSEADRIVKWVEASGNAGAAEIVSPF